MSESPTERQVSPCAWAHRYNPRGPLHALRDNQQDAEDDVASVGGSAHVVALYDQAALDAAVAAERERCAKLCEAEAFVEQWYGLAEAARRIRGPAK